MRKNKPVLYDPLIINRVKKYLEENVDKTYLDVGIMTKTLQDRYPEYSRRKVAPFRALVEQAYHVVSQSYGLNDPTGSAEETDASDLEVMDDSSNNIMSNMMNNLYNGPKAKSSSNTRSNNEKQQSGEAIDISSDESCNEGSANLPLAKNSAITVTKLPLIPERLNNKESSSATSTTTDTTSLPSSQAGRKRNDSVLVSKSNDGEQPAKKQKSDNGNVSYLMQQMQRHSQQLSHQQPDNHRENSNGLDRPFGHSSGHRPRKYKKEVELRKSRENFQEIGGMEKTLKELCELLMHIKSPDIYFVLGLMPPRGILLHGPPGCGKTLLAQAIAGQLNLPLIEIPATELIAGVSGESEERIRDVFEQAASSAPCVLFIDEIDAISLNRSMAQRDMERRVVSQLISSLDNLKLSEGGQSVLVIGATTRPDILDPALRRVGRFDHEIAIGIPTRKDRKEILTIICEGISVEPKCDFDKIAELTPGYVGADLLALVSRAATIAVKRKCSEQMRAFQLKTQRNITIVDLDDENEESENKIDKDKGKGKEKETDDTKEAEYDGVLTTANENAEDTNTDSNAEPMMVDTTTDDLAKTDTNKILSEDSNNPGKYQDGGIEAKETAISSDIAYEANEKSKDDISNLNEGNEPDIAYDTNEKSKDDNSNLVEGNEAVKLQDPTLCELLNWLDNPPEDITFVSDFCITLDDFCEAVKVVKPSAKREGFITVPDVTWDDVGSLQDIREELKLAVLAPVKYPEKMARLGLSAPSGILLCGPPGCGKTLLAKAIANEAGINFISVKGPELMNMYVGESERAVRACFQRARNSAPCVIFFDEFDSLCPKRSTGNEGGSGTRVVNQLLTEMDGVEDRQGVYILAATNRPDIIDPAILRPGRLDTILYVGLPDEPDRIEILKAKTKGGTKPVLDADVSFEELASLTDGYTGADLAGLVHQASMLALKESLNKTDLKLEDLCVNQAHFKKAIELLRPSVNAQDREVYEKLRLKYGAPRVPIAGRSVA